MLRTLCRDNAQSIFYKVRRDLPRTNWNKIRDEKCKNKNVVLTEKRKWTIEETEEKKKKKKEKKVSKK